MPERKIIFETFSTDRVPDCDTHTQIGFQKLIDALKDGWILDPTLYLSGGRPQPMRLENAVIYHLIKYTNEELVAMAEEQKVFEQSEIDKKLGLKIIKIAKVPWEEVNDLLDKGYVIRQEWAKEALLYLYEKEESEVIQNGKEKI